MKRKIISLCASLAALILEIIPYGVAMNFANPEGPPHIVYCSYFDPLAFGYALFPPLITAILTCALLLFTLLSIHLKKDWRRGLRILAGIAALISVCLILYGLNFTTVFSFAITGALALAAILG